MIKYLCDYELTRGSKHASGFDLRCTRSSSRDMAPGERWLCPTSLFLDMPRGVEAQIRSRSGLSLNHGVIVLNAPGTVDADYRGELGVTLINLGQQPFTIIPGERIAQLVFAPVIFPEDSQWAANDVEPGLFRVQVIDELSITVRGTAGHGSTGLA